MKSYEEHVEHYKQAITSLYDSFVSSAPESLPGMQVHRDLIPVELEYLIAGAGYELFLSPAAFGESANASYIASAVMELGWCARREGGTSDEVSPAFIRLLDRKNLLLQFYAMLVHLKRYPLEGF